MIPYTKWKGNLLVENIVIQPAPYKKDRIIEVS